MIVPPNIISAQFQIMIGTIIMGIQVSPLVWRLGSETVTEPKMRLLHLGPLCIYVCTTPNEINLR